jgi:AbiJ N-terminal domain 4
MPGPFSGRYGYGAAGPLIFEDAPESLRVGLREVLHTLGWTSSFAQLDILSKALRASPGMEYTSEYEMAMEVTHLTFIQPWHRFFDAIERLPRFLPEDLVEPYYDAMNILLAEERIGYRFEASQIIRVGTDEFHAAVEAARNALRIAKFEEPRRQFERANDFRNDLPPDWANSIKEAVNSVEAVLQIIYDRPGVALPTIVTENLPADLPGGIKRLFGSLYSQGSGTVGARHASIGGNEPTAARAELAIHVAAALHAFSVDELDA